MGVFSFFIFLFLSLGCQSHSVTKRQALFQDVVRQRTHGNRIAQCPCVIHPESRQCISYDSRYQATGPEEAMLAFIDLSNGRYAPRVVNSATFSCNTPECQHCFALLYYRLQEIGMLHKNYRTVINVLPRNRVVASLCPRFKFPTPPIIPAVPSQQPDYVRSMISAGLRFAHSESTVFPRQFNNRGRFRPGPRLQDQRPVAPRTRTQQQQQGNQQRQQQTQTQATQQRQQPVQPQWQQQQREQQQQQPQQQPQRTQQQQRPQRTQEQQWQQNQPNVQLQQPVQQTQQWTQPTVQQPSTQWNPQWNQQQPNVGQNPAVNWGQTAAATGAIVGSVLDAAGQWVQRQPRPQPQPPQPTPPPPQPQLPQPQFPQPQQPQFPQPQQPQPGWNNPNWGPRPDWGNNGHHWGHEGQWWPNGHNGNNWGQPGQPFSQPGGGASMGGGVHAQVASALNQLPFSKRSKRATPALIGRRFTIGCTNRGEASLNDDGDFLSLCGSCWTWRELPEDYFPRILNELSCREGDFCLSGWGQCKQQFRNVDVLRRVDGRWVPTVITTATCCDCRVKAGTEIHAMVVGDKKRT